MQPVTSPPTPLDLPIIAQLFEPQTKFPRGSRAPRGTLEFRCIHTVTLRGRDFAAWQLPFVIGYHPMVTQLPSMTQF